MRTKPVPSRHKSYLSAPNKRPAPASVSKQAKRAHYTNEDLGRIAVLGADMAQEILAFAGEDSIKSFDDFARICGIATIREPGSWWFTGGVRCRIIDRKKSGTTECHVIIFGGETKKPANRTQRVLYHRDDRIVSRLFYRWEHAMAMRRVDPLVAEFKRVGWDKIVRVRQSRRQQLMHRDSRTVHHPRHFRRAQFRAIRQRERCVTQVAVGRTHITSVSLRATRTDRYWPLVDGHGGTESTYVAAKGLANQHLCDADGHYMEPISWCFSVGPQFFRRVDGPVENSIDHVTLEQYAAYGERILAGDSSCTAEGTLVRPIGPVHREYNRYRPYISNLSVDGDFAPPNVQIETSPDLTVRFHFGIVEAMYPGQESFYDHRRPRFESDGGSSLMEVDLVLPIIHTFTDGVHECQRIAYVKLKRGFRSGTSEPRMTPSFVFESGLYQDYIYI